MYMKGMYICTYVKTKEKTKSGTTTLQWPCLHFQPDAQSITTTPITKIKTIVTAAVATTATTSSSAL